jgi:hypothetical protein
LARRLDRNHPGNRRFNRRLRIQDRIAKSYSIGDPMQKAITVLPTAAGIRPSRLEHAPAGLATD